MAMREATLSIVAMAAIAYLCRATGFWLVGRLRLNARGRAWLEALPVSVLAAIVAPLATRGGPPEWLGLAVTLSLMKLTGRDYVAALAGVFTVALARAASA